MPPTRSAGRSRAPPPGRPERRADRSSPRPVRSPGGRGPEVAPLRRRPRIPVPGGPARRGPEGVAHAAIRLTISRNSSPPVEPPAESTLLATIAPVPPARWRGTTHDAHGHGPGPDHPALGRDRHFRTPPGRARRGGLRLPRPGLRRARGVPPGRPAAGRAPRPPRRLLPPGGPEHRPALRAAWRADRGPRAGRDGRADARGRSVRPRTGARLPLLRRPDDHGGGPAVLPGLRVVGAHAAERQGPLPRRRHRHVRAVPTPRARPDGAGDRDPPRAHARGGGRSGRGPRLVPPGLARRDPRRGRGLLAGEHPGLGRPGVRPRRGPVARPLAGGEPAAAGAHHVGPAVRARADPGRDRGGALHLADARVAVADADPGPVARPGGGPGAGRRGGRTARRRLTHGAVRTGVATHTVGRTPAALSQSDGLVTAGPISPALSTATGD